MDLNDVVSLFPIEVVGLALGYIMAACMEIWGVNWLKEIYNIDLPIFSSMLLNAYWPIQYLLYQYELQKLPVARVITGEMYRSYIILGELAW